MAHSAPSVDLVLDELEEGNNAFVFALDPEALELEHEFFVFSSSFINKRCFAPRLRIFSRARLPPLEVSPSSRLINLLSQREGVVSASEFLLDLVIQTSFAPIACWKS